MWEVWSPHRDLRSNLIPKIRIRKLLMDVTTMGNDVTLYCSIYSTLYCIYCNTQSWVLVVNSTSLQGDFLQDVKFWLCPVVISTIPEILLYCSVQSLVYHCTYILMILGHLFQCHCTVPWCYVKTILVIFLVFQAWITWLNVTPEGQVPRQSGFRNQESGDMLFNITSARSGFSSGYLPISLFII